jgi:hypothetical protein
MDTGAVAIIVASLGLAGSAIGGWWTWTRDRRKIDVDATTAAHASTLAATESSVALALKLRDEMAEERAEDRKEVTAMRDRVEVLEDDMSKLRVALDEERAHSRAQDRALAHMQDILRRWVEWGRDLHERWHVIRTYEHPPPLPPGVDTDNH